MPEIAEIARITHFLRLHLVGKRIKKATAPDDANVFGKVGTSGPEFQKAVTGKTVVGAGNQGKYFWILLDSPPHPVMHFGMTGWIHIRGERTEYNRYYEKKSKEDLDQWPPKFWKFQLETDSDPKVEVAFTDLRRFGRVRLVDCPGQDIRKHSPLFENGPDPVIDKKIFTEDYLRLKMKSRHVPVKALLLDQAMISGIGNWVGDEIMYQAKLHPEQYSDEFSDEDIGTLYNAINYVCDTAVQHLGDSDKFPQHWLFNHRWGKGKKDSATTLPTGEKIIFLTVGGRTSCVVPSVQKKRGRTTLEDVKYESDEAPENETESKFFATKEDKGISRKSKVNKEEIKKVKTAKRKAIKVEVEEPMTNATKKPKKSKTDEAKPVNTTPELGRRRRSGRLQARLSNGDLV